MLYLELPQALGIASELGGHVRDTGLLVSALARPAASMFGEDAYPGLGLKAAALFSSLARDHPLVDGNKRFSWVMTATFLEMNGFELQMPTDRAFDLVLTVAQSNQDLERVAEELNAHLAPI
ncbi:MAG: type II toxin-antitoxin system death-on-curing family toxin [Leucobacter sp.]